MWVPAQKLSVYHGQEATLVCVVEAHPEALVYWEFNGQMVQEINGVVQRQIRGPPKYKVLQFKIYSKIMDWNQTFFRLQWNCIFLKSLGIILGFMLVKQRIQEETRTE